MLINSGERELITLPPNNIKGKRKFSLHKHNKLQASRNYRQRSCNALFVIWCESYGCVFILAETQSEYKCIILMGL